MEFLNNILNTIRSTIRYKLLTLVLFPIVLIMPIALALAVLWGTNFAYQQLYYKVNTDLTVAHDIFYRIRKEYNDSLALLGESFSFRTALVAKDNVQIQELISRLKAKSGFSYLVLLNSDGVFKHDGSELNIRRSSSLSKAKNGDAAVGIEIFSANELSTLSKTLLEQVEMNLVDTLYARPSQKLVENRGMMIRALYPIKNKHGDVIAILDGGVLLNGNFQFVDAIRDLVYAKDSLAEGSVGTVTVFLDDIRISTNVSLKLGDRALGTRVSDQVRTKVLDEGEKWIARAYVVNDWYISSYEPIIDVEGKRVGMLYAGYLESPYRLAFWQALAVLGLLFLALMWLSAVMSVRGAKSIFKPLEAINRVVQQASIGNATARIGSLESRDELGKLAKAFDEMLTLLQQRSDEIQQSADLLEHKVAKRTEELVQKNEDLQHTIKVLRQTRKQLVVAEKLAALGELTAGVAHEINNPTQVMLGNLDILVAQLGDSIKPVQEEVSLIIKQVYRIQSIVNSLLQYAQPNDYAGYLMNVDVNDIVKELLPLTQHMHAKRDFDITLKLEADAMIEINPQELQQVLINLLVNAVHALPDHGGHITISTRNWLEKGVCVCVHDNGHGIAEEEQERIFNPFYSSKREGQSGTGLGLSVSYGLIRRYGGSISVTSTINEGSNFFVFLLKQPEWIKDEETLVKQLQEIESEKSGYTT